MSFIECMKVHTHRQYRTYLLWSEQQWNKPSRTDNYLMSIEAELKLANGHKKVKRSSLILPFTFERDNGEEKQKPMDKTKLSMTKQIWQQRVSK
ncbi:hypothetical protein OAG36_00655 [bacterium]|nr:hypothetical protein [bacterium]